MAQVARFKAWNLPLPENVLRQIVDELQGHIWYPPQEDLTLSDDAERGEHHVDHGVLDEHVFDERAALTQNLQVGS